MFNKIFSKNQIVVSPINGVVMPLDEVADPVFSSRMMGDGIAVKYGGGNVVAPISGEIMAVVPSSHAFGIKSDSGLEILVHIGLETVRLKGGEFVSKHKIGDRVNVGDVVIEINEELLKESPVDLSSPIILTNAGVYNYKFLVDPSDTLTCGQTQIIQYTKK